MINYCFVCKYEGLYESPYDDRGVPSEEICPCCGFHYGFDDDDDDDDKEKEELYNRWREKWIVEGYKWFSKGRLPSEDWNPVEQMKRKQ